MNIEGKGEMRVTLFAVGVGERIGSRTWSPTEGNGEPDWFAMRAWV